MGCRYECLGHIPVVGDWDGDGIDTGGHVTGRLLFRFRLLNANIAGATPVVFDFGQVGDVPVTGDWDGDGIDTIGVFRPSEAFWYLRNSNSPQGRLSVTAFAFGQSGHQCVVGNWDGRSRRFAFATVTA